MTEIFDLKKLLSLSFTELISLRNYYYSEINTKRKEIRSLKTNFKAKPIEENKTILNQAKNDILIFNKSLVEIKNAINQFIENLK